MKDINSQIKEIIDNQGLKITKVASATGIDYQRLIRILNQDTQMLASEFIILCTFLRVDPNYFINKTA